MKKLMIAAAIVCAAAMSQAATVNWGGSTEWSAGTYDGYCNEGATYYVYLLDSYTAGSDTLSWSKNGTLTVGEKSYGAIDSHTLTSGEGGEVEGGAFSDEFSDKTAAQLNGKYLAVVVYDPESVDDKCAIATYLASGLSDGGTGGTLSVNGSSDNFTTAMPLSTAAAQDIAAVPEPTSGLLLLLGVAGLALRRRRA